MGLLDSNLFSEIQKSGNFTCDLTSNTSQNPISFGSAAFASMKIVVSDVASGTNFGISIKGAVVSNAKTCNLYDREYKPLADNRIIANGEYYADITGYGSVYFFVSTRPQSGTATVQWSVSPVVINKNGYIEGAIKTMTEGVLTAEVFESAETLSLASVANIKQFTVDTNKYKCLVLLVNSITDGGDIFVYRNSEYLVDIYDMNGNIYHGHIKKKGYYYVHVAFPANNTYKLNLRNTVAVENGSASIAVNYLREFPKEIAEIKPVQEIVYTEFDFASNAKIQVISWDKTLDIVNFKYYFIAYMIKNGNSQVGRNVTVSVIPYRSSTVYFKEENIIESESSREQSDWLEVKGIGGLRIFAKDADYQEGDKILIGVYGVR